MNEKKEIKVLIVDDEEVVVEGIKKSLENQGFLVDTILRGEEAIKQCSKKFYDVVIVDLIMPGLDGIATCDGIKNTSPETEVLLISGFPNEAQRLHRAFLKVGGKDMYLRKPILGREIGKAIYDLLGVSK
jgi:two-component system, OmpR family, response regulator VicR